MAIPFTAFALFFGVFAIVISIVLAKLRADARTAARGVPEARIAGPRRSIRDRFLGPGGFAYGLGLSAVLSLITCTVLAYRASRPEPPRRHTYQIYDISTGKTEIRELTEQELHEQYEGVAEGLRRIRAESQMDAGPSETSFGSGWFAQ